MSDFSFAIYSKQHSRIRQFYRVSQVAAEKKLFRVTISTDYEPKLLVYLSRILCDLVCSRLQAQPIR